jgi:hypothetical protein
MKHKYFFGALLVGAHFFTLMGCASSDEEESLTVPEAIQGMWVTDDPEYAGQRLELMEGALLFYIEEEEFDPYVVRKVQTIEEEVSTLYQIAHTGRDGGEMTLGLRLIHADSTLVFKNQPFRIWRKVELSP